MLQFFEQKEALPLEIDLLKNTSWLSDLAFLVDVTNYLSILNHKLQGKYCSLPTMFYLTSGFKEKLNPFSINLSTENIDLFPTLKHLKEELNIAAINYSGYQSKIRCLSQSFKRRFQEFESKKQNVQIFINLFIISLAEIVIYPANIQLKLELQNHDMLKNLYANKLSSIEQSSSEDFADFWKLVPKAEFPKIIDPVLQFSSSSTSTYVCEKVFPTLII